MALQSHSTRFCFRDATQRYIVSPVITEENFIDFKCPYCQEPVSFPEVDSGYARACPICTETLIVPGQGVPTGGKLPLPVSAARLSVRRFIAGDWSDLLDLMSKEDVFRYTFGGPLEEDDVLRWIEMDRQLRLTTPDQWFYMGIELSENQRLVGIIGLRFMDPLQAMVHILVNPAFQRQGIAREAVRSLLKFCFEGIHLHRVVAKCDSRNAAALKLFETCGLRREGEFIKDTSSQEGWLNTVCFGMLKEEYQQNS